MNNACKRQCIKWAAPALLIANALTASAQPDKLNSRFDSAKAVKELSLQNNKYVAALKKGRFCWFGQFIYGRCKDFQSGRSYHCRETGRHPFYGRMIRAGVTDFRYTTVGVWGSDNNLIVEEGTLAFALANGTVVARGRYLLVWKREGELKIFRDSFSSD